MAIAFWDVLGIMNVLDNYLLITLAEHVNIVIR